MEPARGLSNRLQHNSKQTRRAGIAVGCVHSQRRLRADTLRFALRGAASPACTNSAFLPAQPPHTVPASRSAEAQAGRPRIRPVKPQLPGRRRAAPPRGHVVGRPPHCAPSARRGAARCFLDAEKSRISGFCVGRGHSTPPVAQGSPSTSGMKGTECVPIKLYLYALASEFIFTRTCYSSFGLKCVLSRPLQEKSADS